MKNVPAVQRQGAAASKSRVRTLADRAKAAGRRDLKKQVQAKLSDEQIGRKLTRAQSDELLP